MEIQKTKKLTTPVIAGDLRCNKTFTQEWISRKNITIL